MKNKLMVTALFLGSLMAGQGLFAVEANEVNGNNASTQEEIFKDMPCRETLQLLLSFFRAQELEWQINTLKKTVESHQNLSHIYYGDLIANNRSQAIKLTDKLLNNNLYTLGKLVKHESSKALFVLLIQALKKKELVFGNQSPIDSIRYFIKQYVFSSYNKDSKLSSSEEKLFADSLQKYIHNKNININSLVLTAW